MKPIVGITMGDPAGIGPEIIVKSLMDRSVYERCKPIIIGDARVIKEAVEMLQFSGIVNAVSEVSESRFEFGTLDVLDLANLKGKIEYGKVSPEAGAAAFESVVKVIELAMRKQIHATVTAPINKESIHLSGNKFSGHTEIYAHYTNTKKYAMLLVHDNLRVIHVSTHVSLRQACDLAKKERIIEVIHLLNNACQMFGVKNPKIGVAGLNPHSSDNGLFGWEEEQEIIPAIIEAQKTGLDIEGPIPADTMFSKAIGGQFDGCVAMYHDQGHIPFKVVGFSWDENKKRMEVKGVNITLGLPIIRVSVDHGTAFEIAGMGFASEKAMSVSIDYAINMAQNTFNDDSSNF